jgi:hypothetical protein
MNDIQEKIISGKITALEVCWQSRAINPQIIMKDALRLLEEKGLSKRLEERLHKLIAAVSNGEQEA